MSTLDRHPIKERWLDDYMYPAIPPRFGCDESYFGSCTREQGAAFLRGELDYCPECAELVEPFEGDMCAECEEAG